jgi:rsbT co-antagonist protein RsbR
MLTPEHMTEDDVERRTKFVGLQHDDLVRLATVKSVVVSRADDYTTAFFDYLAGFEEAASLFSKPEVLKEAKRLKREHLIAMVQGDYSKRYVDQRLQLAALYGEAGLDVRVFLGAYHYLMTLIGGDIMARFIDDPAAAFKMFVSLKKVGFFDIAIIIDALIAQREHTIGVQQEAIRELSTPVLQLRQGLLILPIIGVMDTQRARQLTDALLRAIRSTRAKVVVMDITGVAAVDSKVANHLVQTVEAARLMGTVVIVTGLSAAVAQTLVVLGVDLSGVDTLGDLQGGIEKAERLLGYKVSRGDPIAA